MANSLREILDNLPFQTFEVDHERGALLAQIAILQDMVRMQRERLDAIRDEGILVDKTTHRIRFTDESESSVRIIVEPIPEKDTP
jgi:hypothetical protein